MLPICLCRYSEIVWADDGDKALMTCNHSVELILCYVSKPNFSRTNCGIFVAIVSSRCWIRFHFSSLFGSVDKLPRQAYPRRQNQQILYNRFQYLSRQTSFRSLARSFPQPVINSLAERLETICLYLRAEATFSVLASLKTMINICVLASARECSGYGCRFNPKPLK